MTLIIIALEAMIERIPNSDVDNDVNNNNTVTRIYGEW